MWQKTSAGLAPIVIPERAALEHGSEKRRAETFAGNVRDQKGCAVIAHREHIEIIASDRQDTGELVPMIARCGKSRKRHRSRAC